MEIIAGAVVIAIGGGYLWGLVERALKRRKARNKTIERRLFTRHYGC
jgi:hypothetical protein